MNTWDEKLRREHTIMEITINNILDAYNERKDLLEDGECTERECAKRVYDDIEIALNWYIRRKGQIAHEYYGSEQR